MDFHHACRPEESDPLRDVYRGASVFIDGATGFVGKGILEKLLRTFGDDIARVYLFIRKGTNPKKPSDPVERLFKEILANKIFLTLRRKFPTQESFDNFIHAKIVPITGDLMAPRLGLSPEDREEIRRNCNIFIHCAATVDFDERLDLSLEMNTMGTLRLMDLAEECERVDGFVHVSSAYVNGHLSGRIRELVYPMNLGVPRDLVNQIRRLKNEKEIERMTEFVLQTYPNTYTFTKSLTELLILERCKVGNSMNDGATEGRRRNRNILPVSIVRASIVGASAAEPVRGWIDGMAAAGAGLIYTGLGLVHFFPGNTTNLADIVPVDHVVNVILAAAVTTTRPSGQNFRLPIVADDGMVDPRIPVFPPIYHASTSSRPNPTTWHHFGKVGVHYWSRCNPVPKFRTSTPSMNFIPSNAVFTTRFFLSYQLPYALYAAAHKVANTFGAGSERMDKNVHLMRKMVTSAKTVTKAFAHFTDHSWIFEDGNVRDLHRRLGPAAAADIDLSYPDTLCWDSYLLDFNYGLHYFVLNQPGIRKLALPPGLNCVIHENVIDETAGERSEWEDTNSMFGLNEKESTMVQGFIENIRNGDDELPVSSFSHLDQNQRRENFIPRWFADLQFAFKTYKLREGQAMQMGVEWRPSFLIAGRHELMKQRVLGSARVRAVIEELSKTTATSIDSIAADGERVFNQMQQRLELPYIRFLGWFLHKFFRRVFESVRVCEGDIMRLKRMSAGRKMLLLPVHRSYVDFLVVSFVMFKYNMPVPAIASGEDFLTMGPVSHILRHAGAFFVKRGAQLSTASPLYSAILTSYTQALLSVPGSSIELFLEGTRSRTGKTLSPKFGIMSMLLEPTFDALAAESSARSVAEDISKADSKSDDNDLLLVPIGLSYERVLEESLISREVLGDPKPQESLSNLAKARKALFNASNSPSGSLPRSDVKSPPHPVAKAQDTYGRVHFSVAQPISVRNYTSLLASRSCQDPLSNAQSRKQLVETFAKSVQHAQMKIMVISPVSLLAAVVLASRINGGVTVGTAKEMMVWLRDDIRARGYKVDWEDGEDLDAVIFYSLRLLQYPEAVELVSTDNFTDLDAATIGIPPSAPESSILTLAYSRNMMSHCLFAEAVLSVTLLSFDKREISVREAQERFGFIRRLLQKEFVIGGSEDEMFAQTLARFTQTEYVSIPVQGVVILLDPASVSTARLPILARRLDLFASIIYPFLDTYWTACCTLSILRHIPTAPRRTLLTLSQWTSARLLQDGKTPYAEVLSLETLRTALQVLVSLGIVTEQHDARGSKGLSAASLKLLGVTKGEPLVRLPAEDSSLVHQLGHRIEQFRTRSAGKRFVPSPSPSTSTSIEYENPIDAFMDTVRSTSATSFDGHHIRQEQGISDSERVFGFWQRQVESMLKANNTAGCPVTWPQSQAGSAKKDSQRATFVPVTPNSNVDGSFASSPASSSFAPPSPQTSSNASNTQAAVTRDDDEAVLGLVRTLVFAHSKGQAVASRKNGSEILEAGNQKRANL